MAPTNTPKILRKTVALTTAAPTSPIFDIGAIDLFYALPSVWNVTATFYRDRQGNGAYGNASEPITLVDAIGFSLDQGEMSAWSGVQLSLATGTSISVDLVLNCRGQG